MKFTAKTEYGVRAIIEIAAKKGQPAKVNEIAKEGKMPERFLEQIMSNFKKADLVKSIRGAHGGYILTKKPEEITLSAVIESIEGPMALVDCLEVESSCEMGSCAIRDVWKGVQSVVLDALDSITIKQLLDKTKNGGSYVQAL